MKAIYRETPQHKLNRRIGYKLQRKESTFQQCLLIATIDNKDMETETVIIELNNIEYRIDVDLIYNYLTEWESLVFDNDDQFETKLDRLQDCEELAYTSYKAWYYDYLKKSLCR